MYKRQGIGCSNILTDDGKLRFPVQSGETGYAVALGNGSFATGSEADASSGWYIEGAQLYYNNSNVFYVIPTSDSDHSILSRSSFNNTQETQLYVKGTSGNNITSFHPTNGSAVGNITAGGNTTSSSVIPQQSSKNGSPKIVPFFGPLAAILLIL